jgi:ubiquinone/menaquinone biosynthesis C-methylase UbiE
LIKNQQIAELKGLQNLRFVSYTGNKLPFDDCSFDIVVTRYALHHFSSIENTF